MTVFIARDGAIIGEYPREDLEAMAQRGELETEDHFWQEGMEDWLPLPDLLGADAWEPMLAPTLGAKPPLEPQPPTPSPVPAAAKPWRLVLGIAAVLLTLGLAALLLIRSDRRGANVVPVWPPLESSSPTNTPTSEASLELRDKAAADLRHRIERLPGNAAPPLNTFYYDVRVEMRKTVMPETPWSARMRGFENVIDPATQSTLSRTDFTLTADYHDGEWTFNHYRASVLNVINGAVISVEESADSPTPPSLVGILGLKRREP